MIKLYTSVNNQKVLIVFLKTALHTITPVSKHDEFLNPQINPLVNDNNLLLILPSHISILNKIR